jgi:hypothetical protein
MARKPTAYPELLKPGEWSVEEWDPSSGTPPCASSGAKRMIVPAGNSKFARDIRFHELMHVAKSPPEVPTIDGVSHDSLLAAEDCRVNLLGSLIRPHDALGASPLPDGFAFLTTKSELDMARLAVACLGYASSDAWIAHVQDKLNELRRSPLIPPHLREHAKTLRAAIAEVETTAPEFFRYGQRIMPDAEFSATVALARWLDSNFADGMPQPGKGGESGEGHYSDGADDSDGDAVAGRAQWGRMTIDRPPLSIATVKATSVKTTPSLSGSKIQNYNRLATGEIFGRRRKGTTPDAVLIDQSGSMHWDASKLAELVKAMPVGIVAGYAGESGRGVLRILAKDGRMVATGNVAHEYGGNEVDGPALRWLAQQPGRKVWVSDEGVCSDAGNESDLMADCRSVTQAAGIRTCLSTNPKEILRTLRGGKKPSR